MSIFEKNVTYTFVGNVTNGYADAATADLDTMPAGSIALLMVASNEVEEGALVAGQMYEIVNKLSDGTILRSPAFTSADLVATNAAAYVQPSQQVSFLGYDGTTINGLGTITLGDSYTVSLSLAYTAGEYSQQPEIKTISAYATDTLQATVAKNLFESHLLNFGPIRQKNPSILCDRIARTDAVAALTAGTDTNMAANKGLVYLTHGSKNVLGKSITIGTGAAVIAAADIGTNVTSGTTVFNIPSYNGRVFTFTADAVGGGAGYHTIIIGTSTLTVPDGGTDVQNAAAIILAINASTTFSAMCTASTANAAAAGVIITYKEGFRGLPPIVLHKDADADGDYDGINAITISSGDAVSVKYVAGETFTADGTEDFDLDEPWQGPTGYVYAAGTTEATGFGVATINAANAWGLKFTGLMQPFNPVVDRFTMVEFDVLGGAFGAFGTEYKAVKANEGHGNWRSVATLEQYAQGNETFYRTSNYPYTANRTEAVAGTGGLGYDIITAVFKKSVDFAASGVTISSPFTLIMAFRSGLAYDTINTPL